MTGYIGRASLQQQRGPSEEDLQWLVLLNRRDVEYMRLTFGLGWPDKAREWLQQCVERDRSDRRMVAEEKAALADGEPDREPGQMAQEQQQKNSQWRELSLPYAFPQEDGYWDNI